MSDEGTPDLAQCITCKTWHRLGEGCEPCRLEKDREGAKICVCGHEKKNHGEKRGRKNQPINPCRRCLQDSTGQLHWLAPICDLFVEKKDGKDARDGRFMG